MDADKRLAIERLQRLQEKYHQFYYSPPKSGDPNSLFDESLLKEIYNDLKTRVPGLRYEEFLSSINDYAMTGLDSRYQNTNFIFLLALLSMELKPALEERYGKLSNKYIIGTMPMGQVNGFAVVVRNSSYRLILLSEGVFGFCHLLTKAIAPIFISSEADAAPVIDPELVLARLREDKVIWNRVFDLVMAYAVYQNPFKAKRYKVKNQEHYLIGNALRESMEMFLLAHEFGHIVRLHLEDIRNPLEYSSDMLTLHHVQELEADSVGVCLTMETFVNKNIGTAIGFAGAHFLFASMQFFEICMSILKLGNIELQDLVRLHGTHPPFVIRQDSIKSALDGIDFRQKTEILDFSNTLDSVLDVLLGRIIPALWKAHKDGIRPSEYWSESV